MNKFYNKNYLEGFYNGYLSARGISYIIGYNDAHYAKKPVNYKDMGIKPKNNSA